MVAQCKLDAEKIRNEARRILQAVDCSEGQHKKQQQSIFGNDGILGEWLSLFSGVRNDN
jgi:hypothetical protein